MNHQNSSSNAANLALNHAYGVLEDERRRAVNAVGLEASLGFLHETSGYQTKQSLVYDLQEPFRWIADATVMKAFESGVLDLPDFYFTGDDYRYRFVPEAKARFFGLLRERFNSGVTYEGRSFKWDTIIERKAIELGRCLTGQSGRLDFSEPAPVFARTDSWMVREAILRLTESEARDCRIGKSKLRDLHRKVANGHSFRLCRRLGQKLLASQMRGTD